MLTLKLFYVGDVLYWVWLLLVQLFQVILPLVDEYTVYLNGFGSCYVVKSAFPLRACISRCVYGRIYLLLRFGFKDLYLWAIWHSRQMVYPRSISDSRPKGPRLRLDHVRVGQLH